CEIESSPCESIEAEWTRYKNCLTEAAKSSCRREVCKDKKVRTPWWTKEVSKCVKDKKRAYRKFLNSKSSENLQAYRLACRRTKQCVREAKSKSWEDFGHHVEGNFHNGAKRFWSLVKQLRIGGKTSTKSLLDTNGKLLVTYEDIMGRCIKYLQEHLNADQKDSSQIKDEGTKQRSEKWDDNQC
ncbi:hypothetical protein JGG94_23645, partial [Salmonella enterica subsp. enterica serovar Infantis]|nr:hypothetical protein [Salmonella enterica subsp. enterica serovar Infantis]